MCPWHILKRANDNFRIFVFVQLPCRDDNKGIFRNANAPTFFCTIYVNLYAYIYPCAVNQVRLRTATQLKFLSRRIILLGNSNQRVCNVCKNLFFPFIYCLIYEWSTSKKKESMRSIKNGPYSFFHAAKRASNPPIGVLHITASI